MKRARQTDMIPIARLARRTARLPAAALLICAALCLALAACSQSPPPAAPAPSPSSASDPAAAPTSAATALTSAATAATAPPSAAVPEPAPSTSPPADVAFTHITAGKAHACGLRENAAPLCWGGNLDALDAPAETDFRQISAGLNFTCALRQNAAIACWGLNSEGQAAPPQGAFSEVSAGKAHACAIPLPQSAPPQLLCWGRPFPNGAESLPMDAPISGIQSGSFTCGLTPQSDMACVNVNERLTEITPGPFTRLAVGNNHVCALREDGGAFCQGSDDKRKATPPPTKFTRIAAGWHHSCGITQARAIECWGSSVPGAPGERLAAPDGDFAAIAIGWQNSCALRPNGRAVCWRTPSYMRRASREIDNLPSGVSLAFGGAALNSPVDIFQWRGGGFAIADRAGVITLRHDRPDAPPPRTILDLAGRSVVCCENGSSLLSATLDPQFQDFPYLYVWYRAVSPNAIGEGAPGYVGRLARFRVENDVALKNSELPILDVHLPVNVQIDGAVRFGPDGMLYLGIGENASSDYSQALDMFQGKIIRIDVRGANALQPYRIPPDNPFVDAPGALPEIWAYGMRNPWRMAFDPKNPSNLFVADVGKQTREEVSIATAGANLGWPLCEGDLCAADADRAALAPPAVAYGRDVGCAIIGGVTVPWLDDAFIFSDLCARRVWLLERDGAPDSASRWRMRELADLVDAARNIVAFGIGENGGVYILSHQGPALRLDPSFADNLTNE